MVVTTEYTRAFQGQPQFPASRKFYREGRNSGVRAPFRQVELPPPAGASARRKTRR